MLASDLRALEDAIVTRGETDGEAATARYRGEYAAAARNHVRDHQARPASVLVLTVGTQPDSVALSLVATPARHVVFLVTDESAPGAGDGTRQHADAATRLAALDPSVERRTVVVRKSDAASVYAAIGEVHRSHPGADIVVDQTSGTKVMTAALAAAAAFLGQTVRYIEAAFRPVDAARRVLVPFHRAVVDIEDPARVLGWADRTAADAAYARGDYAAAADLYKTLDDRRNASANHAARRAVARAEAAAEGLDFKDAALKTRDALRYLAAVPRVNAGDDPLYDVRDRLTARAADFERLRAAIEGKALDSDPEATRLLGAYLVARAQRTLARDPSLAALLAYRTLELALQRRARTHGVDTGDFRPGDVKTAVDADELLARYNAALADPEHRLTEFPRKLALAQTHSLLRALADPVFGTPAAADIARRSEVRNRSLYAHGFGTTDAKAAASVLDDARRALRDVVRADDLSIPDGLFDAVPLG